MRKSFLGLVFSTVLVLGSSVTHAIPVSVVGNNDTLIATANLADTGESTELNWVRTVTGDVDLDFYFKTENSDPDWYWQTVDGKRGSWAFEFQGSAPEYFLVKTGNNGAGNATFFLYDNIANERYGVIDLNMGTFSIKNICKLSHISEFNAATVPEPGTMSLVGIGLLSLAGYLRGKVPIGLAVKK